MNPDIPDGATPLDPDESTALLAGHVTTRKELDELEEANIQLGLEWGLTVAVLSRRRVDVLREEFLYELHRRMFGEVWDWAGEIRRTNKNIGVDKFEIRTEVRKLVEDTRLWREDEVYPIDEIAVRFHHRLVWIHPFHNGNGRHSRLVADLIVQQGGRSPFSWGSQTLTTTYALRTTYIAALRSADGGDIKPLLDFARS
jgi:Fic-DOC domain mobile mystery protein B